MTLVCKSVGILDGIVHPIHGCGAKITADFNPIYAGLERSCPTDSKNVSCVDERDFFLHWAILIRIFDHLSSLTRSALNWQLNM